LDRRRPLETQTSGPLRRLRSSVVVCGKFNLITKVRVAGSNPVVRSNASAPRTAAQSGRRTSTGSLLTGRTITPSR